MTNSRFMTAVFMAVAVLTRTSAHFVVNHPTPFPMQQLQTTSPLDTTSFPHFPCQYGSNAAYDFSKPTAVAAGSSLPVSFIGSAVHGGGSCQFSLSTTASDNYKDWKVIKTIQGGCPGTAKGNLQRMQTTDGYPDGPHCNGTGQTECVQSFTWT